MSEVDFIILLFGITLLFDQIRIFWITRDLEKLYENDEKLMRNQKRLEYGQKSIRVHTDKATFDDLLRAIKEDAEADLERHSDEK